MTKEQANLKRKYIQELHPVADIDKEMIKESIKNYVTPLVDYSDKVCLDLGANIGTFAKIAVDHGAKKVYALECDSRNFNIAEENFKLTFKVNMIHAAVSASTQDYIQIYKSDAKSNHSSTSIHKRKGTFNPYERVKNYHIEYLLQQTQPDLIKVDIEGAEYDVIDHIINYNPEILFIEIHAKNAEDEQALKVLEQLKEKYPTYKIEPITAFSRIIGYDCLFKLK